MKKLISMILLYLFLLLPQLSCKKLHYLITDIEFSGATISKKDNKPYWNYYEPTNIFTKDLVFIISLKSELVTSVTDLNFISTCYAFKRGTITDNSLLIDTYSITFDKQFIYNGEVIQSGTNLFKVDEIKDKIRIFENYMSFNNTSADEVIEFSDEFIKNAKFNEGKYTVKFECETSNNLKLSKNIIVEFNIK